MTGDGDTGATVVCVGVGVGETPHLAAGRSSRSSNSGGGGGGNSASDCDLRQGHVITFL